MNYDDLKFNRLSVRYAVTYTTSSSKYRDKAPEELLAPVKGLSMTFDENANKFLIDKMRASSSLKDLAEIYSHDPKYLYDNYKQEIDAFRTVGSPLQKQWRLDLLEVIEPFEKSGNAVKAVQ